jgi:excisionase family DNA binding protein
MRQNQLQIASRLKINRVYVARLIADRRLSGVKVGRSYKVATPDLDKFLGTKYNQTFYTISDVAELLKIHRTTVAKLISEGTLKAVRLGRFFRISESALSQMTNGVVPEKVYTINELSDTFHIARTNLVRSIEQNKLKAIKLDGEYRISKKDAEEYFHIPLV